MAWSWFPVVIGVAVAAVACGTDLASRRIPNSLTYPTLALAVGFALVAAFAGEGVSAIGRMAGGLLVCGGPFLVAFLIGGCGGGDVKLMAALGALLQWPLAVEFLVWTLLAGSILAVGLILTRGQLMFYLRRVYLSAADPGSALRSSGAAVADKRLAIPFAVAALVGAVVTAGLLASGRGPVWWPA